MLTVLNAKDRNRAFIKFIGLFVVTMVLVICAAWVDFRGLPEAKKKFLEQNFEVYRAETQNQEVFVNHMEGAAALLDSLDKSPENATQIGIMLITKLNDMDRTRQKDTSLYGKMNAKLLTTFLELQRLKKERVELNKIAGTTKALEQQLRNCEANLDTYRSRPQVGTGY